MSLVNMAHMDPAVPAPDDMLVWRSIGGMMTGRGRQVLTKVPSPVPLWLPQILVELTKN
jgi:hypothetical protein